MTEEQTDNIDDVNNDEIIYPGVSDRIKATVIDSFVIVGFMLVLTFMFSKFENVPDNARIVGVLFVFGLYDPLFTSLLGGTIGHMMMNIRVKRVGNQEKNILLPLAILRYVLKVLLGWISLLTVGNNEKKLAIHDMVIGSVVIYKK